MNPDNAGKLRVLVIIASYIIPLICLLFIELDEKIDPMLFYLVMLVAFPTSLLLFTKALKNEFIPFILLQLIFIFIFIGNKLPLPGLFKPYILIFGQSVVIAGYYIITNFKYLWKNHIPFRLLFIFFILNIPYYLFHHTDFRSSGLTEAYDYAELMKNLKQILAMGFTPVGRSFSGAETKLAIYLASLSAIVCFTVPLMLYSKLQTINEINYRILKIIKFTLYGFLFHFAAVVFCISIGFSQIGFLGGRLVGDFIGDVGLGFHLYMSIFAIILFGYKIFLNRNNLVTDKEKKVYNILLSFFILVCWSLVILHVNKTTIILLSVSFLFISLSTMFLSGEKLNFEFINEKIIKNFKYLIGPVLAGFGLIMFNMDFVDKLVYNITERFSSTGTLDLRATMWKYFIEDWIQELNVFNFIFGFGIDSSRELAFFLTFILAGNDFHHNHIHNWFLDVTHDYGLVALLYFGAIAYIIFDNLKVMFNSNADSNLKLFSIISFVLLFLFLGYHMTDCLRIPMSILFFALMGFFEATKHAYRTRQKEHSLIENKG